MVIRAWYELLHCSMWNPNGGFVAMRDAFYISDMMSEEGRRPAASLEITNISRRSLALVTKRVSMPKIEMIDREWT